MFKKMILAGSLATVLSFSFALPALAETEANAPCGFWKNVFGRCNSSQSANVFDSRIDTRPLGTTSRENKDNRDRKLATTTSPTTLAQIQCVEAAVATRENSLVAGMTTYTGALNTAYSTRASELASAYSKTTATDVRAGIKTAWKNFNANTKVAQKSWRTAREGAWNTFKTAAKACKTTESVTDSANAVTEMSGE